MKYFIVLIIGEIIGGVVYHYMEMPREIERRAKDLDLMHYNGKLDKFVPKDSIKISGDELNYIIYGTTKN